MTKTGVPNTVKLMLGTMFGAGYVTKAPGTLGSFLSLPFIYASFLLLGFPGLALFSLLACLLSLWAAPVAIETLGEDPGEFIMDECAGESLVFTLAFPLGVPINLTSLLLGFLMFRFFDIIKPLGIKRAEKLRGKFGILLDDLLAGLYASVILAGLFYLISTFE